ncbi:hypothetical protein AB0J82_09285 [Asanoa sp. NPDC049518]|uniref:hypothetical protein n=1 Tax=unclassified Asanoa TaxID=2685164 RepID=UPI00342D1D49
MTPADAMGHAVAAVAAGLRKDREALAVLLNVTSDDAVDVAGGMVDLVGTLARIVGDREDKTPTEAITAAALGRSALVQNMAEFAIAVIDSDPGRSPTVDASDVIVGLGALAGRLAEQVAEYEGESPLQLLGRIGTGVAELEAFDPPD